MTGRFGGWVLAVMAALLLGGCGTVAPRGEAALPTAHVVAVRSKPASIRVRRSAPVPVQAATSAPSAVPATATAAPPTLVPTPPTITPVPLPAITLAGATPTPPLMAVPTPPATPVPAVPPAAVQANLPAVPNAAAPGATPILMYHYVRQVDRSADPMGFELSVTPDHFAQQLDWLAANGYATVRMDQLTRCLRGEPLCPARSVALTFDDGYEDAFTTVLPLLQQHGFTATFYIISGVAGQPGYMSWDQVRLLHQAGMEIGAHSVRHLNMTTLDPGSVQDELVRSRADIERAVQARVTSFCYPAGHYNGAIEEQVRAAGYSNATTTRWDADWSDVLALPRRRVSGDVDVGSFAWIVQN